MKKKPTTRTFGHVRVPLKRVHLELTNVCEFNCVFCPKSRMTRPPGFMETRLAKETLSTLGAEGICDKVTLHVMGEPTLHKDFFEILAHARNRKVPIGLTTNGRSLGGPVGRRLLSYPLHQIDVSLQTPDPASFSLRKARSLSFEAYLSGILDFFFAYKKRYPETIFKFRFLNTRFSKKEMEKAAGPLKVISSTRQLRRLFHLWANRVHTGLNTDPVQKAAVDKKIDTLVTYKWNVLEVHPRVYFETYVLEDWGHAFDSRPVREAWAGYCFGMRDHFAVLYNGDVTLCCIDYDGQTAIGNLKEASLEQILSSDALGEILAGFDRFRLVHPYCKKCLGSTGRVSWLVKPLASIAALKLLRPFFYAKKRIDS